MPVKNCLHSEPSLQDTSILCMKLTPKQSILIFGWFDQPREHMNWDDVKTKSLSWHELRLQYNFTAEELHTLQPDKEEWMKRGQLTLHDVLDMNVFPVNPFDDMRADLAEVWNMHWSPEALASMKISYGAFCLST
jgi:hypothetical protein